MTTAAAVARAHLPPGVGVVYGALWACTAAGVGLAALAGVELTTGAPRDALPARPGVAVDLFAHNALVMLWPLALLWLGWAQIPVARIVGDGLVSVHVVGHGLLIGSALGAHPDTWRYLPHLPVEWLALAVPAGAWLAAGTAGRVNPIRGLIVTAVLLAGAALMEIYAVPL